MNNYGMALDENLDPLAGYECDARCKHFADGVRRHIECGGKLVQLASKLCDIPQPGRDEKYGNLMSALESSNAIPCNL